MKKLLSLPPNLAGRFTRLRPDMADDTFCTNDPVGHKLGSGGGTIWLLEDCRRHEAPSEPFERWIGREKRILLHAGGQSRRLPAYAPSGKVLTPIPVFRWALGQKIGQTLLDLQLPLYEQILESAPTRLHTLVVSGDVFIRTTEALPTVPEADVVCYGLWAEPELARGHGVFIIDRKRPAELDFMLQKPAPAELARISDTHYFLMDIGVWLLSDRAVQRLRGLTLQADGSVGNYDLYGQLGCGLGNHPSQPDEQLGDLSVAILPLTGGEFYHYGTSRELLSSTTEIQNLVKDQRYILQHEVKPQPSIFTQNALIHYPFSEENHNIWVENSCIPEGWQFSARNIVTGVPRNDWAVSLSEGQCVDVVPIGADEFALRPYGFLDAFRGPLNRADTLFLEQPMEKWLSAHHLRPDHFAHAEDLQAAELFPVSNDAHLLGRLLAWMLNPEPADDLSALYMATRRVSADTISDTANFARLVEQRRSYRAQNLPTMARNWGRSVFYQTDLGDMAAHYAVGNLQQPAPLPQSAPLLTQARDAMFRSECARLAGHADPEQEERAFGLLRKGLTETVLQHPVQPKLSVCRDQIVWGRSPVRIDLAGGWTDTPPYSLYMGGNVVNLAILLNGQPPLQVYVKPCKDPAIICRSIDLGAMERIESYEQLVQYNKVGSPFSIPKAALALAGFAPGFGATRYASLREQLADFGCGIEITLLAAIPAGSGLGTSSILAATVLGAISDFCGLAWDRPEIGHRTLVLEQMLTTGGGWQDQYGGILPSVKLLQTERGFAQLPLTRWLPNTLFEQSDYRPCHLLYYTGLTRTAKNILAEIVRSMFLNRTQTLALLGDMKEHAIAMHNAIQRGDFALYGRLLRKTWQQNKALDSGTSPAAVEALCRRIDDYCLGYKLPGAGGGGYLYMVAKDAEAARRIRQTLQEEPLADNARFVEMQLSTDGLQVSRS